MEFLFELGTEELPALPLLKELGNILPKWNRAIAAAGLRGEFALDYTPRRIVISGDVSERADDVAEEFIGAPRSVAVAADGSWSTAAVKFAQKCGITTDELAFAQVKGKEVLYRRVVRAGGAARELLAGVAREFVAALHFGRSMRWGRGEFEFIRPVRNVILLLGDELIECEICGVRSRKAFLPHRSFGYAAVEFATRAEYFDKLAAHGVILQASKRREKILAEFAQIEANSNLTIERDEDLLAEVVAITEYPSAFLGGFEAEFLKVPSEAIILSMKENQRYFPVFDGGRLANKFVAVSNSHAPDIALICQGNERVLRARLSDAAFFYEQDLRAEFSPERLRGVSFMARLGSVYDKAVREARLARMLGEIYGFAGGDLDELERAAMLSKADLTSAMVYEFTDLQGVMGSYYARAAGCSERVCAAISEQYLPKGESGELPSSKFSAVVALACKFDTLLALFAIGELPSGTKDPYGLRRAAAGVLRIVREVGVKFDLGGFLARAAAGYAEFNASFDVGGLKGFILERAAALSGASASVVNAVLRGECGQDGEVLRLFDALAALDAVAKQASFRENFSTFKRVANILKDAGGAGAGADFGANFGAATGANSNLAGAGADFAAGANNGATFGAVNPALFEAPAEQALWADFCALGLDLSDTASYLAALFGLKGAIDAFFDAVMINAKDERVRANRIALLGAIYAAFLKVADIKEISA